MGRICTSKIGALPLTPCEPSAKVNAEEYAELPQPNVVPNFLEIAPAPFTAAWRQDNAAAHTGRPAREHLGEACPRRLIWLPQSQS